MTIDDYVISLLPKLHGWCDAEKARRLYELVEPNSISIESGTYGGRSAFAMAIGHQDKGGIIYSCDPFDKASVIEGTNDPANTEWWTNIDLKVIEKDMLNTMTHYDFFKTMAFIKLKGEQCACSFPEESINLIHIDSNHSELVSCREVELLALKLRKGGMMVLDDVSWPTLQKAQSLALEAGLIEIEKHENWKIYQKQ